MYAARYLLSTLIAVVAVPAALAEEIQYVPSRHVLLTFAADGSAPVTDVALWVSTDGGQKWEKTTAKRVSDTTVGYAATADGPYGFYLVLKSDAGVSGEPPKSGDEPHLRVVVDTVAPMLQLHGVSAATGDDGLAIRATLMDDNLGSMGVRIFCRPPGQETWTDAGIAPEADGLIHFHPTTTLTEPVEVRVVATDLAGNQATDELRYVPPPPDIGPAQPVVVKPAEPVTVKPAAPVTLAGDETTNAGSESLEHLRGLGQRFMRRQQYDLAAARFEDAAKLSPDDADVLVDLGSALYWSKRYDEAQQRFTAALKTRPDHRGALEGLALVAATERRYPQAREHLLRLLELSPDSGVTWLRYGDIEHKLGNADKANEAWLRVLELKDADDSVREKARKRLSYFRPPRRTQP